MKKGDIVKLQEVPIGTRVKIVSFGSSEMASRFPHPDKESVIGMRGVVMDAAKQKVISKYLTGEYLETLKAMGVEVKGILLDEDMKLSITTRLDKDTPLNEMLLPVNGTVEILEMEN